MNLSGLGAALGAVPGGYQQGQLASNQIETGDLAIADAKAKAAGAAALWRALQGAYGGGGQGPQPPAPGQPSVPSMQSGGQPAGGMQSGGQPPMAMNNGQPVTGADGGIMPPMQSTPAAMPASGAPSSPGGPPGAAGPAPSAPGQQAPGGQPAGQPPVWQSIVMAVKQHNPGVDDRTLMAAVDHAMPLMTLQQKLDWQQARGELMYELGAMRSQTQQRGQDKRAETTDNRTNVIEQQEQGRQERFGTSEDRRERSLQQRGDQFQQREQRLQDSLNLRNDATWARLNQQKDQAQQRILQGDRRDAVTQWRAAVDAQHKLAMEKIQTMNVNNQMKPADKQKLISDQNAWYNGEIERLRGMATSKPEQATQNMDLENATVTNTPAPATPQAPAAMKPVTTDVRNEFNAALQAGRPRDALLQRMKEQGYDTQGL